MALENPIKIQNCELTNSLVLPPMATCKADETGLVTDSFSHFYLKRVEGGSIGLVVLEHAYVAKQGIAHENQLAMDRDEVIEPLKAFVEEIHNKGSKIIAQITHAGSNTSSKVTGQNTVAPSSVKHPMQPEDQELPQELSKEEIQKIESLFVAAAKRVKAAGFDGVEIHSAHGYFLNQFYSPLTNKRTDEYGSQNLENRLRIHKDIITQIREEVGDNFIISIRFGGCDYIDGGSTIEDGAQAAQLLEQWGINLINASGGMCGYKGPGIKEPGYFKDLSSAIKAQVSIPVVLTGGIKTREDAEALLAENAANLIGVGRAFLKNPFWAQENLSQ
ncbi:MAG: NADH:flavin oxidoreductase [Anaerotardibacter sp.]